MADPNETTPLVQHYSTATTASVHASDEGQEGDGHQRVVLGRKLGLTNAVSIILGTILGAGIFVSPTGVLRHAGSTGMSLIVWIVCGFVSTIGAVCYAELGTMIPKSGGDFVYISAAFGPLAGFLHLWVMLLIIAPAGNAVLSLTFANYLLRHFYDHIECSAPVLGVQLIAASLICEWMSLVGRSLCDL